MSKITSFPRSNETAPSTAAVPASCSMDVSSSKSVDSINRKTLSNLYISAHEEKTGIFIVARKFKPSVYVVSVSIL